MSDSSNMRYTDSHEWVRLDDEQTVTVGVTDYAQNELGEVVFVELPQVGQAVEAGSALAVIESVKAASDIYAPLDGAVIEVNEQLIDQPEMINQSPCDTGWLYRLRINNTDLYQTLKDESEYNQLIGQ